MQKSVNRVMARLALSCAAALATQGLWACDQVSRDANDQDSSIQDMRAAATDQRASLTGPTGVCEASGAHVAHGAMNLACETCHSCGGGSYGFDDITFPRGTTTAGGELVRNGNTTTCTVGCHNPFGAPTQSINWDSPGPLPCTRCHSQIAANVTVVRSGHMTSIPDPSAMRAVCSSCHILSNHMSGTVRIALSDGSVIVVPPNGAGAAVNSACQSCHDGDGASLNGRTPPILVGYDSPTGDFHGSRTGSGWGGTLLPPYQRGQSTIACTACHDPHASGNSFLFASGVNGSQVPENTINRAGVGAEVLCQSCHQGARHAGCTATCHTDDPAPAGVACFYCHGHEGIVNFVWPTPSYSHGVGSTGCEHCHSPAQPLPEYQAPYVVAGPTVQDVQANRVTVTWDTSEYATSYVEFGVGGASRVAGNNVMALHHAVTLTGLVEGTSYVYRLRSSDRYRNVMLTADMSFNTLSPLAPAAPILIHQPNATPELTDTFITTLRWNPVSSPDGHPVQYRVVLDDSSTLSSPVVDSGWITAASFTTTLSTTYFGVQYYWHVMARDSVEQVRQSTWSATDSFWSWIYDPYDDM